MTVKTLKDNLVVGDKLFIIEGSYGQLFRVTWVRERIPEKRMVAVEPLSRSVNIWSIPS